MTEEEMEDGVTPEILPSNELAVIIKETQLEPSLAQEFQINFEEHFRMASEWAKKAKKIIVTDPSQVVVMQEARTARLFLREKRLEIEKFRVSRKEYFLKGGRAIDKVANFLKDTIIPIEEHLDRQEHYVENLKKAEEARVLAEFHAKQEADIKAAEEANRVALAKAQEEIRLKNIELAKAKEIENKARAAHQAELDAKDKARRDELDKIRKENESRVEAERIIRVSAEKELRLKREAEAKIIADKAKAEEALKNAGDVEKIRHLYDFLMSVKFPEITSKEGIRALERARGYVVFAKVALKDYIQKNII